MNVVEIWNTEYYRDGGSYGFSFDSDDGKEYEFFMQVNYTNSHQVTGYSEPVIYLQDCNSGKIVEKFTWEEAQKYVAALSYDNDRFVELVQIINSRGKCA